MWISAERGSWFSFGGSRTHFFYSVAEEISPKLISEQAYNDYLLKFKILQKDYIPQLHRGIDRYAAVVAFNEGFYKLRDPTPSALGAVRFRQSDVPDGEIRIGVNFISNAVIAYMANTDWLSVYGLNYHETMALTYSEWTRMQVQLAKKHTEQLPSTPKAPSE